MAQRKYVVLQLPTFYTTALAHHNTRASAFDAKILFSLRQVIGVIMVVPDHSYIEFHLNIIIVPVRKFSFFLFIRYIAIICAPLLKTTKTVQLLLFREGVAQPTCHFRFLAKLCRYHVYVVFFIIKIISLQFFPPRHIFEFENGQKNIELSLD